MRGMEGEMLKGHLDMIVLAALAAAGPAHGYAIIEEIKRRSGGAFELPEGTIYPALHRLEQAGLLQSRWTTADSGRRRRVYSLTRAGIARWSSGAPSGNSFPMRSAACSRRPATGEPGMIEPYLELLARELDFDRSLSRCVRGKSRIIFGRPLPLIPRKTGLRRNSARLPVLATRAPSRDNLP